MPFRLLAQIFILLSIVFPALPALCQTLSSHQSDLEALKNQVALLKNTVSELETENKEIKIQNEGIKDKILLMKGLDTGKNFDKSMLSRTLRTESLRPRINISGDLTAVVLGTINQKINTSRQGETIYVQNGTTVKDNFGQKSEDRTVGAGSFDLYIEGRINNNMYVFTNLEANSDNEPVDPSLAQPNGNATFSTHLDDINVDVMNVLELYVENFWYGGKLITTIGKIDLTNYFDGNKVAWDEHTQFLSGVFLDDISFASVVPLNTPGARARLDLGKGFAAEIAGVKQQNSGNKLFNEWFGILELDYCTHFFRGLEGNYRIYGYVKDINQRNSFGVLTDETTNALGGGLSADQKLTEKLTVFGRCGYNDKDLAEGPSDSYDPFSAIDTSYSFGGQYEGLLPNRPHDVFGGAFGVAKPSEPPGIFPERPFDEYFMEFYYSYKVSGVFHVSPVAQFMLHPNGDDDESWITLLGARAFLEF